ncbi:unnamed protein product [Cuscuta campestris]|uniref:Uncharacterized protein n=1 Tax=Cuscuta campestris TaxID=132261 RepID=A0A484N297_9ASTE|nr:unnamed protein product [Cuscuta campestris]
MVSDPLSLSLKITVSGGRSVGGAFGQEVTHAIKGLSGSGSGSFLAEFAQDRPEHLMVQTDCFSLLMVQMSEWLRHLPLNG